MECCGPASARTETTEASACTLDDTGRQDRLGTIQREVLPHVKGATALPDGFAWECAPAGRENVERWVELERQCCGNVSWEVMPRSDGSLRLEVRGADPAVGVLASLYTTEVEPKPGVGSTLARAGGLGAAASFGVLCLLPMALAAVFGSAVAAPFAGLESPATLAGGTLAFAALIVWFGRRRRRAQAAEATPAGRSPCGC